MPSKASKKSCARRHTNASASQRHGEKPWHMGRVVSGLDSFGSAVPSLNIGGETTVNTLCGGIVTGLILLVTLIFAAHKATELVDARNPTIIDTTISDVIGNSLD